MRHLIQVDGQNRLKIFKQHIYHPRVSMLFSPEHIVEFDDMKFLEVNRQWIMTNMGSFAHMDINHFIGPDVEYHMMSFNLDSFHTSGCEILKDPVIDVSVYDPMVLVLTLSQVIELMFVPEYDGEWRDMRDPRVVEFNPNTRIQRVFAFDFGNIAIDQENHVWAWTTLDHPFPDPAYIESMKKIRTNPIHLSALDEFKIVHVEPSSIVDHTRFYYASVSDLDNIVSYHDVPNADIIALIAEAEFTPETLARLSDQVRI